MLPIHFVTSLHRVASCRALMSLSLFNHFALYITFNIIVIVVLNTLFFEVIMSNMSFLMIRVL